MVIMIKFIKNQIHPVSFEALNIPLTLEQVVLLVDEKIIGEHNFEFNYRRKLKDIKYTGKRNGPIIEIKRSLDRVSNIPIYPTAKISFSEVNGETELKATFELQQYYTIGIVSFYCLLFIGLIVDSYLLETLLKRLAILLFHVAVVVGSNSLIHYHHRTERRNILLVLNQVLQDQTKNATAETVTEELPKVETVPQTEKPKLFGNVYELGFLLVIMGTFYLFHTYQEIRYLYWNMTLLAFSLVFGALIKKITFTKKINYKSIAGVLLGVFFSSKLLKGSFKEDYLFYIYFVLLFFWLFSSFKKKKVSN
ncbi:MAG: hypothetical protein RL207_1018 [Bacteroidota bacterium]